MKFSFLGNFNPPYSTENDVAKDMENLGHEVHKIQEGETRAVDVPKLVEENGSDYFWWVQTYGLAVTGGTIHERADMLSRISCPTIGLHLDKWWDLPREDQISTEPFFRVDYLFTADGGNQARFADRGIRHIWSPPAVLSTSCYQGRPTNQYLSDVGFVGSWQGNYHPEWAHRHQLTDHLARRFKRRMNFWPRGQGIRGDELNNLYASIKVIVGDSCGVGGTGYYCSDRIPETLGRGGFLLHPWVKGIDELFIDGQHIRYWEMGNWQELDDLIHYYLTHDSERIQIAEQAMNHVRSNHTYLNRISTILQYVTDNR